VRRLPVAVLGVLVGATATLVSCAQAPRSPVAPQTGAPSRPKEVRLTGFDPCTLITPRLRTELDDLNDHFSRRKADDGLSSSDCSTTNIPSSPVYVLGIRLVVSEGADQERTARSTPTSVAGFSALQQPGLNDAGGNRSCLLVVDTAPGEALWVSVTATERIPPGGYAAMCAKAHIAAEGVMHELLARTP
jgi:hypothetical protein